MQRPRQHPYRRKPAVLWLYAAVGINYQRLPFSQIANYDTSPASQMNCLRYVKSMEHANRLRKHVEEDNNGVMKLSASVNETLKRACLGYEAASKTYPELHHNYGRPKG